MSNKTISVTNDKMADGLTQENLLSSQTVRPLFGQAGK